MHKQSQQGFTLVELNVVIATLVNTANGKILQVV